MKNVYVSITLETNCHSYQHCELSIPGTQEDIETHQTPAGSDSSSSDFADDVGNMFKGHESRKPVSLKYTTSFIFISCVPCHDDNKNTDKGPESSFTSFVQLKTEAITTVVSSTYSIKDLSVKK